MTYSILDVIEILNRVRLLETLDISHGQRAQTILATSS